MNHQPLIKLLTASGAGSRRKMTDAIKRGRVAVNGKVVDSFLQPIKRGTDNVTIDGESIAYRPEKMTYLMLNKPKGITSTTNDERGNKTVIDILPQKYQHTRLYPVGRLDKESSCRSAGGRDGRDLAEPRARQRRSASIGTAGPSTHRPRSATPSS